MRGRSGSTERVPLKEGEAGRWRRVSFRLSWHRGRSHANIQVSESKRSEVSMVLTFAYAADSCCFLQAVARDFWDGRSLLRVSGGAHTPRLDWPNALGRGFHYAQDMRKPLTPASHYRLHHAPKDMASPFLPGLPLGSSIEGSCCSSGGCYTPSGDERRARSVGNPRQAGVVGAQSRYHV